MGYLLNGMTTGGVPIDFIKKLMEAHDIKNFVETGTAGGASVIAASKIFNMCHSIEIVPERAEEAKALIKGKKGIHIYTGDSVKILPGIVDKIFDEPTLFWLDAHYSDSVVSEPGVVECPVMQELDIILDHNKPIIMIDDARLYLGSVPWPNDPRKWPTIAQIFEKLKINFPNNFSTIIDDYVLSVPPIFREAVNTEWRARFKIRYPDAPEKLKSQVKDVYNAFKNYIK